MSIRWSLYVRAMRLIVARCEVSYIGRTTTVLPEAVRLLMLKADGTFMVWADGGSPNVRPLNWMTPPTVLEEERGGGGEADGEVSDGMNGASGTTGAGEGSNGTHGALERLIVRKQRSDERLEIAVSEVLADIDHEVDALATLEKEGLERELQELLAAAPHWCGEGFRLVRREFPTDIGPVDLMCRDTQDEWVAVEIKRIATMDSVRQLTRYLERIRLDPAMASCRGVLVAKWIKPQARVLAESQEIDCVEVDVEVLRGNREPELTLFAT
jgi:endonuclease